MLIKKGPCGAWSVREAESLQQDLTTDGYQLLHLRVLVGDQTPNKFMKDVSVNINCNKSRIKLKNKNNSLSFHVERIALMVLGSLMVAS